MSNVRVDRATHDKLRTLAQDSGRSMSAIVSIAVEAYRREQFLKQANEAYAALREDPIAWAEELSERAAWGISYSDERVQ